LENMSIPVLYVRDQILVRGSGVIEKAVVPKAALPPLASGPCVYHELLDPQVIPRFSMLAKAFATANFSGSRWRAWAWAPAQPGLWGGRKRLC
jgi:hypothetical protein